MTADNQADKQTGNALLEWIKSLGIPIASLFVTGAIFYFQSQQQAFERQLHNVEDGYRFYFDHRTSLEKHSDADQEETLLKLISSAFPNVFCHVRADLYARVASAETVSTATGFGEDDREILLSMLRSHDAPERPPLTSNVRFFGSSDHEKPKPCPPLDMATRSMAGSEPAPPDIGALEAPSKQNDEASNPQRSSTVDAPGAASDSPTGGQTAGDESAVPTPSDAPAKTIAPAIKAQPVPQVLERAQSKLASLDSRIFRVFFQVSQSDERSIDLIDAVRAPLAMHSFRVMRGVERLAQLPSRPEIRYFGPDEQPRAQELADLLEAQFKPLGWRFSVVAIGDKFPNMPRSTLEVWLPNAAQVADEIRSTMPARPLVKVPGLPQQQQFQPRQPPLKQPQP